MTQFIINIIISPEHLLLKLLVDNVFLTEILHHPVHEAGQVIDRDVQEEGPGLDAEPQVDQRMECERGHVRLAPFSSLSLQILLVLNPSRKCHQCKY